MRVTRGPERRFSAPRPVLSVGIGLSLLSCARIEPPPGGPPDTTPPQLIAMKPDSFARLPNFKGDVEFRFDEVISEGGSPSQGAGTGDLEKLILLSPTTRVPQVNWRRDRITVRPAEGWQPKRVYRVELLPGVSDLRRNQSKRGAVLTFTTDAELPNTTIDGIVVDWTTSRPAPAALVEALLLADSLPYRGLADSSGHFSLGPLPAGEYLVRGAIDQNRNNIADPREAFDTVRLAHGKTAAGELWAFVHDTTPPRIQEITVADSVSATVALSQTLDPRQHLPLSAMTVRILPDSTPVRVTSLLTQAEDDSLNRRVSPAKDTLADTTRKQRPGIREVPEAPPARAPGRGAQPRVQPRAQPEALTSRPPLSDKLVVRVERPWVPGGKYEVEIRGVRNTTGVAGDVRGGFTVPKPTAADTTRLKGAKPAAGDTTGRAPPKAKPAADSLKRVRDSLSRAKPKP
ncbi:MAG: Ig-like domain-containing protein [Gemmatimonadales bacterium]